MSSDGVSEDRAPHLTEIVPAHLPDVHITGSLPAGFSARVSAMLIDLILVKILYFSCLVAAVAWQAAHFQQISAAIYAILLGFFLIPLTFPLFLAAYFCALTSWQGQTPGKMFMGIKVVRADGGELGPGLAFLRFAGYGLSLLPLGVGFIQAAFRQDALTWHDQLAGTRVVINTPDCPAAVLN